MLSSSPFQVFSFIWLFTAQHRCAAVTPAGREGRVPVYYLWYDPIPHHALVKSPTTHFKCSIFNISILIGAPYLFKLKYFFLFFFILVLGCGPQNTVYLFISSTEQSLETVNSQRPAAAFKTQAASEPASIWLHITKTNVLQKNNELVKKHNIVTKQVN